MRLCSLLCYSAFSYSDNILFDTILHTILKNPGMYLLSLFLAEAFSLAEHVQYCSNPKRRLKTAVTPRSAITQLCCARYILLLQAMRQQCSDAQKVIEEQCQRIYSSRQPMQRVKVVKEIKQFNPRFEEDFAQEKDYDVDR